MATTQPAPGRRIRPAGWVAIVVIVSAAAYGAWLLGAPALRAYIAADQLALADAGPKSRPIPASTTSLMSTPAVDTPAQPAGAGAPAVPADAGVADAGASAAFRPPPTDAGGSDAGPAAQALGPTTISSTPAADAGPVSESPNADAGPDASAPGVNAGAATAESPPVVGRELFPVASEPLPLAASALPPAAIPPLAALPAPPGAQAVGSEGAALRLVATGGVRAAIVSVAAFAGLPESAASGVRAAWLEGFFKQEAALGPSCDADTLRGLKLGVVSGSLAHFHLLAALAGQPLPPITYFDSDAALQRAWTDGTITGGELPASQRGAIDMGSCTSLPDSAYAFVVVRQIGKPLSPEEVSALAGLHTPAVPTERAAAYLTASDTPDTYGALFDAASRVWAAVKLIPAPAAAAATLDRSFVTRRRPSPAARVRTAPSASDDPLGFRSWIDR